MKSLLPILLFLSFTSHLNAQILSGTVYGEDGKPIENVNIFVRGSERHTHTNAVGVFEITAVSKNDTLLFSHVAFEELAFVVKDAENPLRIVLHEKEIGLSDIVITEGIDALCLITKLDLQTAPVNNSQEVLRKVPGLFIGQHAGGGKAEQIFLRGFDIDHGTDISINVDGMPVNMVSHAHGQGYADLHFIIPETIDKINFGKGPYFAEQGNFNTAGYVDFKTKNRLDEGIIKLEAGQFNSSRILSMFNVLSTEKSTAFVALDVIGSDGPFDSPQNFSRNNVMAKYTSNLPSGQISAQISHFTSKWDASGQVPERVVRAGTIGRFGAIDNTEGGKTSRTNFVLDWTKNVSDHVFIKNSACLAFYDFELFSNFTFFLDDSLNGDQIKQKESRQLFGFKSEIKR
ncbi:MAG: TonB-dependent receptor plug domain-containing protein, partial [Flavobacteriales bacterium]